VVASGGAGDAAAVDWACSKCTFRNSGSVVTCLMCTGKRARDDSLARDPINVPVKRAEHGKLNDAEAASPYAGLSCPFSFEKHRTDPRFLLGTLHSTLSQKKIYAHFPPAGGGGGGGAGGEDQGTRALREKALACMAERNRRDGGSGPLSGVVYLPNFLTLDNMHALIEAVDGLTAEFPLHIPQVHSPFPPHGLAWSNLFLTEAGMVWDGLSKQYKVKARSPIPPVVLDLAGRAVERALELQPSAFAKPIFEEPDAFTALFNYYPPLWGRIGEHSDSSEPGLAKKPRELFPVVSFSAGDTAVFSLWPDYVEKEHKGEELRIPLSSGDALLFGGASRLIRHAVLEAPLQHTKPKGLKMVPGRLNITVRKL
jgi:alkylated DNA repair dioxygenase AlkB